MADPPTCVIYNPTAGRGRAGRILDEARRRLPPGAELWPTARPGHATELATAAAHAGFARVVAAGGDGTVHEVANGLLAADTEAVLSVWPVGSMNDYAFTLGLIDWWRAGGTVAELQPLAVDVGRILIGDRTTYFVDGCGVGFNGMVTVEAGTIRRLRGIALYSLALVKALVKHFATPTTRLVVDGKVIDRPLLAFSVAVGQREGGFPLAPFARLDDGLFDLLHVGGVWRYELVRHFPGMLTGNLPLRHPQVNVGRGTTVEASAGVPLCVHADGVTSVRVELVPKRLRVETWPAAVYGRGRFEKYRPAYENAQGWAALGVRDG